jgi:hypothetical protein
MKTYSAKHVTISFAGLVIDGGFGDGEFLRIEQETDAFGDVVGTDGEVSRSPTNDDRATITIILMQTSDFNAPLSALHNADKAAPNGAGVGPVYIRDRLGTTLHQADAGWIAKPPDSRFDRAATSREWKIRVEKLNRNDGGN